MKRLLLIPVICLTACATRPHTYLPPDAGHLKASTERVAKAVTQAHTHANEAKNKVNEASKTAGEVAKETKALKDVPVTLVAKLTDLERQLDEARNAQTSLEKDLVEADQAKAQVEKDKTEYFAAAQKLADAASEERDKRINVEQKLHWYRIHWWGAWIVLGLGIIACGLWALIKFGIIAGLKL